MRATPQASGTVDEQLGSPALSFEEGWLMGLVLGSIVVVLATRRARRAGDRTAHG